MSDKLNYYEILQVSPHAMLDVIKAAHRTLSKTMHPDAGGSNELAVAINEALDVLSDSTQRARYDLELRIGKAKTFGTVSEPKVKVVEVLMVVCQGCSFKNRVPSTEAIGRAKCGSCGAAFSATEGNVEHQAQPWAGEPSSAQPKSAGQTRALSLILFFGIPLLMFLIGAIGDTEEVAWMGVALVLILFFGVPLAILLVIGLH